MGMPDHFICSWEICMQGKKQQLEPDMEQQTGSKLGEEYVRLYIATLLICRDFSLGYFYNMNYIPITAELSF